MGEWIRHRGSKKQPDCLKGKKFQVRTRNGCIVDINLGGSDGWWEHEKEPYDIMAYRIIEDEPAPPDADGWIEWHGGECPVAKGTLVDVKFRNGRIENGTPAGEYNGEHSRMQAIAWDNEEVSGDIIAYRLSKPDWPENRIDVIGQNGNTGEHYTIDTLPERVENEAENVHVDMVNDPPHYKQGDVECIEAIKSALTHDEWRGYCKGNALKYIWRERHKGGDESLQKAVWYLNRLVK